jgi:hypothetical protein
MGKARLMMGRHQSERAALYMLHGIVGFGPSRTKDESISIFAR